MLKAKYLGYKKVTNTNIYQFRFESLKPIKYIAGQYSQLDLEAGKRWFTISSPPDGHKLSVTTRVTTSSFKQALKALKAGDEVSFAEPMGDFVLPKDRSIPVILVAAGIGITPYLSILGDSLVKKPRRHLALIYAASSLGDFVDITRYKKLLSPYQQVIGHLKPEHILKLASSYNQPYIYISGPEKLVESLVKQLSTKGVEQHRLIADYFSGYN